MRAATVFALSLALAPLTALASEGEGPFSLRIKPRGFDERCLRPHENARVTMTASNAQVREAIHTRAVGRWRHYESHLGPLLESLEEEQITRG